MKGSVTKRAQVMERLGIWAALNRRKVLFIVLVVTAVITIGLIRIELEMTFYSIMPRQSQQVRDLEHISEAFPFASNIAMVVDGRSEEDPEKAGERVRQTVDALVREFSREEYGAWLEGVYGTLDTEFFKAHGLMVTEVEDLDRFTDLFSRLDLLLLFERMNNEFEREYSGNSTNLEEDETLAAQQLAGLEELLKLLEHAASGKEITAERLNSVSEDLVFGDGYVMSLDGRMGLVFLLPTFTMNDLGMLVEAIPAIEEKAEEIAAGYGCDVGLTGMPVVAKDEIVTSEQGIVLSMIVAVVLILGLLILAFRMTSVPLITGIPLLIGILWTVGLTGLTIHRLNMMTAMYLVALLGLGIDYAIHILTAYIQERDAGKDFIAAIGAAYLKSGPGILTGALTTSVTFFVLMISKTEMMRELGFVAGLGILSEFVAMVLILPALLGRRYDRRMAKGRRDLVTFGKIRLRSDMASKLGNLVQRAPVGVAVVLLALGLVVSSQARKARLETNLMEMEAKGLESIELQDEMVEEFGMSPDGLYILTDDPAEVVRLTEELERLDSVKTVESIAPYLVTGEEYQARRKRIEDFRMALQNEPTLRAFNAELFMEELYRLEMNLFEMEDLAYLGGLDVLTSKLGILTGRDTGGSKVRVTSLDRLITILEEDPEAGSRVARASETFQPVLREKLLGMTSTEKITLEMLPDMIRDSYISRDRGEFLISIVPRQNPWEGGFREIFTKQVSSVTDKATGMIYAANQLNRMAETDGLRALILAVITIFLLLLIDFRNLTVVLLNLVPLSLSIGTLIGIMGLAGIKFDFINIIAIPLLIGIGIDDAVHISHRYLYEGPGTMARVVAKTGTAVLLTSLTTMIGFASFIPSIMRGLSSTGIVLSIAMALAFIFSIIMHPASLIIFREKLNLRLVRRGVEERKNI